MEKFKNLKKILSVRKTNEGGKEIMLLILLGLNLQPQIFENPLTTFSGRKVTGGKERGGGAIYL